MFLKQTMIGLKAIIFSILIPGTVAGLIPMMILNYELFFFEIGNLKYSGFIFLLAGVVIYLSTLFSFITYGKGTPAIFFTSSLKSLIGSEPEYLVLNGLYKRSRNPMYLGVVLTVFGEGLYFQHSILLIYAFLLLLIFHLIVIRIEEPHLLKKYGENYKSYLKKTPRWF